MMNDMPSILPQLKSITSAVIYAAEADTVGETLERIADAARDLIRAKYAALGVPDGVGGLEYFMFSGLSSDEARAIPHYPEGRGLLGAIMREREPIRLENMQADPRSSGFPDNHPEMTRFLGVPIAVGDQLFGMLYLTDPIDGGVFSEQDQWLIETVAGYAALAIAGAQLREQRRKIALLEERERIGMDLHDGVIQSLYAIGMHLELLRMSQQSPADDLTKAIVNVDEVIGEIRRYIQDLKMRDREQRTLNDCINDIIRRLMPPDSLNIRIDLSDDRFGLPSATFEAVCQMANEAISNVIRHADADNLDIRARQTNRRFTLTIRDDGRGFEFEKQVQGGEGLGLKNILQRARLNGGSASITSEPGKGTEVTIQIDL